MMKFDPFAEKGADAAPGTGGTQKTQGGDATTAAPSATPTGQPTTGVPIDPVSQQMQGIQRILEQNDAAAGRPEPEPSAEDAARNAQMDAPEYNWNVPQPIIEAISSGDPQAVHQGINAIVNGMAQAMHRNVMQIVNYKLNQLVNYVPEMIRTTNATRELHNKFYGKYRELQNPQIMPVVGKVSAALYQQKAALGVQVNPMDDQFHAEVAEAVKRLLGLPVAPAAAQPNGQGGQPYVAGQGARPADTGTRNEGIMDQLGLS